MEEIKSKFQKEEVMKVIRKNQDICLFKNLNPGDVFKMSETGSLFMKIDNPYNNSLNCLDIEEGRLYEFNSMDEVTDEVTKVDGCFVEGIDENDS